MYSSVRHDSFVHGAYVEFSSLGRQWGGSLSSCVHQQEYFPFVNVSKKKVMYVKGDVLHVERDCVSLCVHYQMRRVASFVTFEHMYIHIYICIQRCCHL